MIRPFLPVLLAACAASGDATDDGTGKDSDDLAVVETDRDTDAPPDTDGDDTDLPQIVDTAPVDTDPPPTDPPTVWDCFGPQWGGVAPVDYELAGATLGRHCQGTNHQDIHDVERVVFIGDSITAGTLPTPTGQWYRNRLADTLSRRFGLRAPSWRWRNVDPFDGMSIEMFSGDFASCAKYGARTDDLLMDPHRQLETCMPEDTRDQRTLVVMTSGGNDIFSLLEDVAAGVPEADLRATYTRAVDLLEEAVRWVVEPGRFPNGVYVVFANTYDFTDRDGAGDMAACDGAQLIGMDAPLMEPVTWSLLGEAQERYLRLAVETGTDMLFLGEVFCGHGWNTADPLSRCYRGPRAQTWTDFTCEHPNGLGHAAIHDMVMAVVDE